MTFLFMQHLHFDCEASSQFSRFWGVASLLGHDCTRPLQRPRAMDNEECVCVCVYAKWCCDLKNGWEPSDYGMSYVAPNCLRGHVLQLAFKSYYQRLHSRGTNLGRFDLIKRILQQAKWAFATHWASRVLWLQRQCWNKRVQIHA